MLFADNEEYNIPDECDDLNPTWRGEFTINE